MKSPSPAIREKRRKRLLFVICPACGGVAGFHAPFAFLSTEQALLALTDTSWPHRSLAGHGVEVALYPSLIALDDPDRAKALGREDGSLGIVRCLVCPHQDRHVLTWPRDAWLGVHEDGDSIWAWNIAHAQDLLGLIIQVVLTGRDPGLVLDHASELEAMQIPEAFRTSEGITLAFHTLTARLQAVLDALPPDERDAFAAAQQAVMEENGLTAEDLSSEALNLDDLGLGNADFEFDTPASERDGTSRGDSGPGDPGGPDVEDRDFEDPEAEDEPPRSR